MKPKPESMQLKYGWPWSELHQIKLLLVASLLSLAGVVVSCVTVNRVMMAPPGIPGATFVGSKACEDCHENITKDFKTAAHARLQAEGVNASEVGCESCHGPGSLHSESGGERHTIVNPGKSPEICFQCHLDKRGEFNLPYHHPVLEGKLNCADCHNLHKGPAIKSGGTALVSENETCFQCHTAQKGPFVFEHEASREGCVACHKPHGSVNPKMLAERDSNACLKCHPLEQISRDVYVGGFPHSSLRAGGIRRLSQGACWSAGCHEAVHGSQVSTSLQY